MFYHVNHHLPQVCHGLPRSLTSTLSQPCSTTLAQFFYVRPHVPSVPVNSTDNLQHNDSSHPSFTTGSSAVEEQTDETLGEPASHSDMNPEVTITETITDLCTDYVARSIINVAISIQEIISNVDAQSCNREHLTLAVCCTC